MQERGSFVEEVAAHLGVNRGTMHIWTERKKMPANKAGRPWTFLASEVNAPGKLGNPRQKET